MRFAVATSLAVCSLALACAAVAACTGGDPVTGTVVDEPDSSATDAAPVDAAEDVADAADAAKPSPFYIFVTGGRWNGKDVGGLASADAKCQAEAIANNYPGTYQAWLSDEDKTKAFPSRVKGNGPWVTTYEDVVAFPDRASLTGKPLSAVNYTSDGGFPYSSGIWTGTPIPGGDASAGSVTCQDWTVDVSSSRGTIGQSGSQDQDWTYKGSSACLEEIALLCLRSE